MKLSVVLSTQQASFSAVAYKGKLAENIAMIKSLGYNGVELAVRDPESLDVVAVESLIKKYSKYGIRFDSQKVGTIIGAAGLILGLAKYYKIKGICLLGETIGYPVLPDPKSAKAVLEIVSKILDLKIDLEKINERVREMEEFLKRMQMVETKAVEQFMKAVKKEEKPTDIG